MVDSSTLIGRISYDTAIILNCSWLALAVQNNFLYDFLCAGERMKRINKSIQSLLRGKPSLALVPKKELHK